MLAAKPTAFKSRTLFLGRLITSFFNNETSSFNIKEDFLDEMRQVITDLIINEGDPNKLSFITPMYAVEWGEDSVTLREKSALDHIKGDPDPKEEILSMLAELTDESVKFFVKALTDTLIEVYKNGNNS